ncbi:hypothetical protein CHS0354_035305 [Potamilus streckersoni]|uniref:HD/PDEase domain-containing protein n=1 Tax=Potamilus streckersoni TaxID=2493646 RepID=A0AAE0S337_9BIVA|nr:hypothetical protein CHS0354_035305 [Potamilus streckersoni]
MDWETIISSQRTGDTEHTSDNIRSDYQRDFDRIVFSSGFRRLQHKTQIFPLPGSTFVHNRLTHSLEVSSVGRSLGKAVGNRLFERHRFDKHFQNPGQIYRTYWRRPCLAHDIGNPAFGHSGESSISRYFTENSETSISGKPLRDHFSNPEWEDLTHFEGNANGFRKNPGGLLLTYTTLASFIKYPCSSPTASENKKQPTAEKRIHHNKYGFFASEEPLFLDIAHKLELIEESSNPTAFCRHPFVFLTEAADDICYHIIDFEDAHRVGIIRQEKAEELMTAIIQTLKPEEVNKINFNMNRITNANERISYLRGKCINCLSESAVEIFMAYEQDIITGRMNKSLFTLTAEECPALKELKQISSEKIYKHKSVIEIEIAGYHILQKLLNLFVPSVLASKPDNTEEKIISLIPEQFKTDSDKPYTRIMALLDFISGMTDPFATDMYRRVTGIEIAHYN